jgi:hypothetical protein
MLERPHPAFCGGLAANDVQVTSSLSVIVVSYIENFISN